jgi:T5SS/PEP-CTERM-associated repeat protein/autotransporter-associated beta strand protein
LKKDNPIAVKKTILHPVLALAGCFAAFNGSSTLQAQTTNIWNFNFSSSIVQWTVPSTGYYDVTAYGAQGGGFTAYEDTQRPVSVPGGRGAVIGGLFLFEQGEVLSILAGGAGDFASGGGGSFVVNSSTNPLLVAGGGGGTAAAGSYWPSASITTSGNNATYVNENRQGSGGTNGTGGTVGSSSYPKGGAGGGGFFGNGQSHYGPAPAGAPDLYSAGGTSYLDGGAGGSGGYFYVRITEQAVWSDITVYAVDGGFGGGGQGLYAGGGGGGYSGGGGGGADVLFGGSGGGGGSFLATSASNDVMRVGHTGNGSVSISAAAVSLLVDESITISSGTNDYYNIVLGGNVGDANNSVSVTNAGTVVNAANYVLVGQNGSSNTMTVSGGASVADQAFSVVGLNATASGNSLRVTGTGSTWSSGGLVIGDSGSGNSMSVEAGGGVVSAGSGVALGYNVGSSGNSLLVDGSGSTLTSVSDLIVGFGGSGNSVVVSNGGTLTNSHYTYGGVIGLNSGATNNSVLVTGMGSTWSNSGDLTIGDAGEGTLTIANGGSVSANAVIIASQAGSSGTLNFGSLGGSDTAGNFLPPVISFGSGSGTINFNQTDTVAATGFSGNGSLNQLGSGTTILTGTNTYSGTTTVNRGTLVVYDKSFQGTSSLMLNGGTMILAGSGSSWNTGANNTLIVGNNSPGVSLVVSNGASLTSSSGILGQDSGASNNSILVTGAGSTWTNESVLYVGDRSSGNSVKVSAGATVSVFALQIGNYGSGNSLEVSDGGQLLTGGDGFGSCIIGFATGSSNNSVLVTGSGSSWNNNNTMNIGYYGSGAVTVANGGSMTAGYLSISTYGGSGALNIGRLGSNDTAGTFSAWSLALGTGGLINFNQSDTTTLSTVISGNGSVNQLGSGTTTLSGSNTYTGATTVAAGTLLVDGQIGLSDVSVLNGAAIGGSGTLGGSLSLAAGAQFVFSLSGALTVDGGSVTFGDFGIDDLVGLDSTVPNGAYTLIDGTAAINFSNVANLGAQNAAGIVGGKQAYFSEGSLVVNVIPEPSTYALLGLGAIVMLVALRRRRWA